MLCPRQALAASLAKHGFGLEWRISVQCLAQLMPHMLYSSTHVRGLSW